MSPAAALTYKQFMRAGGDSCEQWAAHYIRTTSLRDKLTPAPEDLRFGRASAVLAPDRPGRPARLRVHDSGMRTPGKVALQAPDKRAQLVHTFWHHELQAAELMCWALLAFPDTPVSFRRGLLAICRDEIRHMQLYADYLQQLGFEIGDFPVRDWFWSRVPGCRSAISFVATMGVGLEGGNLDHTARFAVRFRAVGDEAGAQLQEQVGREEVPHVRFALHWFRRWTAAPDATEAVPDAGEFVRWRRQLPEPLSPILMRGRPLAREQRRAAGMTDDFIAALASWRLDDPRGD